LASKAEEKDDDGIEVVPSLKNDGSNYQIAPETQ